MVQNPPRSAMDYGVVGLLGALLGVSSSYASHDHHNTHKEEEPEPAPPALEIIQGTYGYFGSPRRVIDVTKTLQEIHQKQDHENLDVEVANPTFGEDPAFGVVKQLKVVYRRHGGPEEEVTVRERGVLHIETGCPPPPPPPLEIEEAEWGHFQGPFRKVVGVKSKIREMVEANGGLRLEIKVGPGSLGCDPAFGAVKELRVVFKCPNGDKCEVKALEGQTLIIDNKGSSTVVPPPLHIFRAHYGYWGLLKVLAVDVTDQLRDMLDKEGGLTLKVNNEVFKDDPACGKPKELRVHLRRGDVDEHLVVQENQTLNIQIKP